MIKRKKIQRSDVEASLSSIPPLSSRSLPVPKERDLSVYSQVNLADNSVAREEFFLEETLSGSNRGMEDLCRARPGSNEPLIRFYERCFTCQAFLFCNSPKERHFVGRVRDRLEPTLAFLYNSTSAQSVRLQNVANLKLVMIGNCYKLQSRRLCFSNQHL